MQKLRGIGGGGGGEDFISELKEEFNLTSISGLGSIGPSLMGGGGLSGIAKAAATAYGGPVAGIAAEAAVDSLTS